MNVTVTRKGLVDEAVFDSGAAGRGRGAGWDCDPSDYTMLAFIPCASRAPEIFCDSTSVIVVRHTNMRYLLVGERDEIFDEENPQTACYIQHNNKLG